MSEAVQTMASPAATWVIVSVMSVMTVVLVSAPLVADIMQARANERARASARVDGGPAPALDGARTGDVAARGRHARTEPVPQGDIPTRADLPAQPAGRHAMPAQRSGEADRAARSYSGVNGANEDETGRP